MKNELIERDMWNRLLGVYGKLLTPVQESTMKEYYEFDLSLAEIAENHSITRAAVLDNLAKARKKLLKLEGSLELLKKNEEMKNAWEAYLKDPSEENKKRVERSIQNGI